MSLGKLTFLIALCILSIVPSGVASHLVIGELSYKKTGAPNTYEITVTYYRDCRPLSQGGGSPAAMMGDNPIYLSIFKGTQLHLFDSVQVTSSEYVSFQSDCRINTNPVQCISKYIFRKTVVLPPSTLPYTIVNQRCCLNASITNVVSPGTMGYSFMAVIPPAIQNSSAEFVPANSNIICLHDNFSIDHSANDPDGDSLSYELCEMFQGGDVNIPKPITTNLPSISPIPYTSGYSSGHPMDYAQIDPATGLLTLQPQLLGHFMICVCCHEWRNGVLINTTRRSFVYQVNNCDMNFNAVIKCDPYVMDFSNGNTCYANCHTDLTVAFQNNSAGNGTFYWDFGVDSLQSDTSTQISPFYQYPHDGYYTVTLITTLANCTDTARKRIYVGDDSIHADFSTNQDLCTGLPINLNDHSTSLNDSIVQVRWYIDPANVPGNLTGKDTSIILLTKGNVFVTDAAFNSYGCYDTISRNLWLNSPDVKAFQDEVIPKKTEVSLYATGANSYSWTHQGVNSIKSGGNDPVMEPYTEVAGITDYIVKGTDGIGCIGLDTVKVVVTSKAQFIIPTAFSPNGDGQNDFLNALHSGYSMKTFKVFNRWGQEVFSTNDIGFRWSGEFKGEPLTMDTYYWFANVKDEDGLNKILKGEFIIVH